MRNEVIWSQKYRPKKIDDCILPFKMKKLFKEYVKKGEIDQNLLLVGPPGLGKTTIALAAMEELDAEYIFINASLHGNIDTLRYEVQNFASKMSLDGNRKYIIFDEAERLTAQTQDAIRGFIETFSKTTGFIFTTNIKSMLSQPVLSRLSIKDFTVSKSERPILMKSFFTRICDILDKEEIDYVKSDIVDFMASKKNSLDFRSLIGEVQAAAKIGIVNAENLKDQLQATFEELIPYLKNKEFDNMRKWVSDHPEFGAQDLFREFYDTAHTFLDKNSVPLLVILIGKYQYQNAFVMDQEINIASFLVEVMVDCTFD